MHFACMCVSAAKVHLYVSLYECLCVLVHVNACAGVCDLFIAFCLYVCVHIFVIACKCVCVCVECVRARAIVCAYDRCVGVISIRARVCRRVSVK